jgi:hypothetical protein
MKRIFSPFVIIAALTLCEFLVVCGSSVHPKPFSDGYFHSEAKAIAEAIHHLNLNEVRPFEHAPGPTIYYAIPYCFLPANSPETHYWYVAVGWNAAWFLVALFLLYRAARLISTRYAFACPLLTLLSPLGVYYSCGVAAETPAFVGCSLFAYGVTKLLTGNTRPSVLGPVFWGLTIMGIMRPNAIVSSIIVCLVAAILWARAFAKKDGARLVTISALLSIMLTAGATIAARSWDRGSGAEEKQDFLAQVLFQGVYQFRTEHWDWRHWNEASRPDSTDFQDSDRENTALHRQSEQANVALSELRYRLVGNYIREHPYQWLTACGVRVIASQIFIVNSVEKSSFRVLFLSGTAAYCLIHVIINATQILMIIALGYLTLKVKGMRMWGLLLVGPWLGLVVFVALTYCEPRYTMPGQPVLAMAAFLALMHIREPRARVES